MMLYIGRSSKLTKIFSLISSVVCPDDIEPDLKLINTAINTLFECYLDRVNIVDLDTELQGAYESFYEAINEHFVAHGVIAHTVIMLGVVDNTCNLLVVTE